MGCEYGDGWLEWGLQERAAKEREEREARGDFGADKYFEYAADRIERAETTEDIRRAESDFTTGALMAAKEARFHGAKIKGWKGESQSYEMPALHTDPGVLQAWAMGRRLDRLDTLPDRYQLVANLADNRYLRAIRQTGSYLIAPDREVKFSRIRVEKARRKLEQEEAELVGHIRNMETDLEQ